MGLFTYVYWSRAPHHTRHLIREAKHSIANTLLPHTSLTAVQEKHILNQNGQVIASQQDKILSTPNHTAKTAGPGRVVTEIAMLGDRVAILSPCSQSNGYQGKTDKTVFQLAHLMDVEDCRPLDLDNPSHIYAMRYSHLSDSGNRKRTMWESEMLGRATRRSLDHALAKLPANQREHTILDINNGSQDFLGRFAHYLYQPEPRIYRNSQRLKNWLDDNSVAERTMILDRLIEDGLDDIKSEYHMDVRDFGSSSEWVKRKQRAIFALVRATKNFNCPMTARGYKRLRNIVMDELDAILPNSGALGELADEAREFIFKGDQCTRMPLTLLFLKKTSAPLLGGINHIARHATAYPESTQEAPADVLQSSEDGTQKDSIEGSVQSPNTADIT